MARRRLRDPRIRRPRHRLRMTGTVTAQLADDARTASETFEIPLPHFPVPMRSPCRSCGEPLGTFTRRGGQCVVSCTACHRFAYNAPRAEQIRWWGRIALTATPHRL